MNRLSAALGLILGLAANSALAQFNDSPIEKMCYGGRNQMGLHLCVCDQTFISGMSALILGNSVVLHGPGKLMDCLIWADGMNGVTTGGGGAPARPPNVTVTPPRTSIKAPDVTSLMALPPAAGPCGEMFNACATDGQGDCLDRFNACSASQVDQARKTAVEAQLLTADGAARLAALSQLNGDEQGTEPGDRRAIKVFSSVATAPSAQFEGNLEPRFSINPNSFLGKTLNIGPPWSGTVTLNAGGTVSLAGDAEGAKPIYIDNILVFCFNGSTCVSVGQRDAADFQQADGGSIDQIGRKGFNFAAGEIDLTPYLAVGQATNIAAYAIDYGGLAGVSDIFLIVEGGTSAEANPQTALADVEKRMRSAPFNFRFSCEVQARIGNFVCDDSYSAAYDTARNSWNVCGKNGALDGLCWEYDNAPATGPYFSAWGIVLKVAADGSMTRDGVAHGYADIGVSGYRRTQDLPDIPFELPPDLGMPGNRHGTAGGSRY